MLRIGSKMDGRGNRGLFIVRDANGQALGYFYFEDQRGRRSAAKLLTRDEARRIAPTSPSCRSCCALADPTLPPCTTVEEAARAAGRAMSGWRAADVFARAAAQLCDFCAARHRHFSTRD